MVCPFRWREWVHQKLNESYKVKSASLINLKPVFFGAQTEYSTLHFPGIHFHCQRPDKSRVCSPLPRDEAHSTAFRNRPPFLVLYFLIGVSSFYFSLVDLKVLYFQLPKICKVWEVGVMLQSGTLVGSPESRLCCQSISLLPTFRVHLSNTYVHFLHYHSWLHK